MAWAAHDRSEPIAAVFTHASDEERYVGDLFVEPSFRNGGIAGRLLDAAFADAGDAARRMLVEPQDGAALVLALRRGLAPQTAILSIAGPTPREDALLAMAAGDYRFQVDALDPIAQGRAQRTRPRDPRYDAQRGSRPVCAGGGGARGISRRGVRRVRVRLAERAHRSGRRFIGAVPHADFRLRDRHAAADVRRVVVYGVDSGGRGAAAARGAAKRSADRSALTSPATPRCPTRHVTSHFIRSYSSAWYGAPKRGILVAENRDVAQLGRACVLGRERPQVRILSSRPLRGHDILEGRALLRPWSNRIRHESSKLEDGGSSPSGRGCRSGRRCKACGDCSSAG